MSEKAVVTSNTLTKMTIKPLSNMPSLFGGIFLLLSPAAFSVEVIPLTFNPETFFEDNLTAGIDFDDDTDNADGLQLETQPGFASIEPSNNKSYNVTTNGITFDLQVRNANLANQNRFRGPNALANNGPLIADFEQFFGRYPDTGNEVEATLTLSGLAANTAYQVSFFTVNVGCCQTRTRFYDGATTDDPLITDFTTSGNSNNYDTWAPGITLEFDSGASGEIIVTLQAEEYVNGTNFESRLGICGISVVSLGPPPVSNDLEITSLSVDPVTDEVTLTFTGDASTTYSCFSSTDLIDFSTEETPVNGSLTTDEKGIGTVVLSASEDAKFYRIESIMAP